MVRATFVLGALLISGCVGDQGRYPIAGEGVPHPIIDTSGRQIGTTVTSWHPQGWHFSYDVSGLSPGSHGAHLHEAGRCDPPDFASAGAHYNPFGKQHGSENPLGPHRGDLGDGIYVYDSGNAKYGYYFLWKAHPMPNGLSLIIHANRDDKRTDPSGNTGARIACSVLIPPG